MIDIDFNFFYKYSVRSLVMAKYSRIDNIFSIPVISKVVYFFILSRLEDVDDIQSYNFGYLFKYFFGRMAFVSRVKSFFNPGVWSYSFKISMMITGRDILPNFMFLVTEFVFRADKSFIRSGIFNKDLQIFYIIIKDMNLFSEKKTNLGLFQLYQDLNLHFFFKGIEYPGATYLLRNMKLHLYVKVKAFWMNS
jgi:hypothetical protein